MPNYAFLLISLLPLPLLYNLFLDLVLQANIFHINEQLGLNLIETSHHLLLPKLFLTIHLDLFNISFVLNKLILVPLRNLELNIRGRIHLNMFFWNFLIVLILSNWKKLLLVILTFTFQFLWTDLCVIDFLSKDFSLYNISSLGFFIEVMILWWFLFFSLILKFLINFLSSKHFKLKIVILRRYYFWIFLWYELN